MTGSVVVAGLGPGDAALITPEVTAALAAATDVVGYIPYVARIAPREGLVLHASDNRQELDRARQAFNIANENPRECGFGVHGAPGSPVNSTMQSCRPDGETLIPRTIVVIVERIRIKPRSGGPSCPALLS